MAKERKFIMDNVSKKVAELSVQLASLVLNLTDVANQLKMISGQITDIVTMLEINSKNAHILTGRLKDISTLAVPKNWRVMAQADSLSLESVESIDDIHAMLDKCGIPTIGPDKEVLSLKDRVALLVDIIPRDPK